MTTTLLISENFIRTYGGLETNLDTAFINNAIREGQDIKIQQLTGTLLYNKLIALVDAGTINDAQYAYYQSLLNDYIQNALIYASLYYIYDDIYVRPRNGGLLISDGGEGNSSVDRSMYNVKKQTAENKYKFYAELLTDYLMEEEQNFPELTANTKLYQLNPDYDSRYGGPFAFSGRNRMTEYMRRAGVPIFQKRYRQYPPN